MQNILIKDMFTVEEIFEEYKEYAKIIKLLVCDTGMLLDQYLQKKIKRFYLKGSRSNVRY